MLSPPLFFLIIWYIFVLKFVNIVQIQSQKFELFLLPDNKVQIVGVCNVGAADLHFLLGRYDFNPMKRLPIKNTQEEQEVF